MKIKKCRSCGSEKVEQFFDLGEQPFANALLIKKQFNSEKKYPLSLSFCKSCGLVQLDYTADAEELFSNYFWVTGTSQTALDYAERFCERTISHIEEDSKGYILELASNDGTFLRPFRNRGYEVLGVDPAVNIAKMATKNGIPTIAEFFGEKIANKIISKQGYPAVVYARNVVPHVSNLHDFIKGISCLCTDENIAIIEVHYAGKILDEIHYDSIYHEHLCYFTLMSLSNLLCQYNLHVYDIDYSPISGGSIVVYLSKKEKEKTVKLKEFEIEERNKQYNSLVKWKEFAQLSYKHREDLVNHVNASLKRGEKIVAYGASARSSTMLNFCGINNELVECVIDKNKLKQRKYTPGSHMKIVSPRKGMENVPSTVLLLAWNFKDEIIKYLKDDLKFTGNVIIPLPYPVEEMRIE